MEKLSIPVSKPRARRLNEVLVSRSGGRMKSPKDFNRQQLKRDLQRNLSHADHR